MSSLEVKDSAAECVVGEVYKVTEIQGDINRVRVRVVVRVRVGTDTRSEIPNDLNNVLSSLD